MSEATSQEKNETQPVAAEQFPLDNIHLERERPTEMAFAQLQDWVIWQFPRPRQGSLCGAVHPPIERYGWLPATVHPARQRLRIYAHATGPFSTPEEAAGWMAEAE